MKIGFFQILTIIFITLKLCSVIDWSWWLVLAPLWVAGLFWGVCFFIAIFQVAHKQAKDNALKERKK